MTTTTTSNRPPIRALVLKSNDLPLAGAVRLVEMYVAHLDHSRVQPVMGHVVNPDCPPTLAATSDRMASLEHHDIEWRGIRRVKAAAAELQQLVRDARIDIVTSNDMRTDFLCRAAGGSKGLGVPWTAFVHGWIGFKRKWGDIRYGFYELMDRISVRAADEVWSGSHACGRDARRLLPNRVPLKVLMNAAEPYYLKAEPGRAQKLREEHGIGPDTLLAGTVGRMAWAKGHALLAEAMVKSGCDNLACVLLGFGEEEERLAEMAKQPPFKGRMILPGPKGSIDDLAPWLEAMDIFCFPSLQESLPVAVLEAMYMDNAIAASITGDLPLVLEDGKNGLLFPPGDVDAMADCLRRMVQDPELRETLRKRAKERVLSYFCAPRYSKDVENAWVDLVERTRGERSQVEPAPALS